MQSSPCHNTFWVLSTLSTPSRHVVSTHVFSVTSTVVVVGCLACYILAASLALVDRSCLSLHSLTRAGHRNMRLKGARLRRSLPLPQTDTLKNPYPGGKNWVANLVIPTKATRLATATAREASEPYGSALPSETHYCEHGWEHGLLYVICILKFFCLCTPPA